MCRIDTLHVHREPAGERYTQVSAHRGDDAVSPEAFGDLTVAVSALPGSSRT